MKAMLWRLAIRVTPSAAHPMFWDWQWGFLHFWIYSEDFNSAAALATAIVKTLPYEFTKEQDGCMRVFSVTKLNEFPPGHKNFEACRLAERSAAQIGIGMLLDAGAVGCDEPATLFTPP